MFHLRLLNFLFFVLLQVALSSSQDDAPLQQVPVCAPLPGSNSQGSFQGPKGSQGPPGKRGADGAKGDQGHPGMPWGRGGCPTVKHHFPRRDETSDYVRYRGYVPSMKEVTICAWIETTDLDYVTILGYASPATDANEITIFILQNPIKFRFIARGKGYEFTISSLPSTPQFHLCLTLSSKLNQRNLYINGNQVGTVSKETSSVNGGGILVLGQDHDNKEGGGFQATQSFWGNMTNFMIWPRVLTGKEVSNIARNCDCPYDHAIAMTLDRVEHFGEAYYSIPDVCPTV